MTGLKAAVLLCMISACLGCWVVYPVKDTVELKSNLQCECGVRNEKGTRIVGGTDASKHEFPWQVGLSKYIGGTPFCGASIISSKTFLTAAHCVKDKEPKDIWAVIGEHDLNNIQMGEYWIEICYKAIHPHYERLSQNYDFTVITANYDFAVLTVCSQHEIDFTKEISPICLPPMGSPEGGHQYEHLLGAIVTGWGFLKNNGTQPNILQKTEVKTMTNQECCSWPMKWSCEKITKSMMCGTWNSPQALSPGEAGTSGHCNGDSGGPLITKGSYGYSQIGIVSFANEKCALVNYPDVYARVTTAKNWIISNTEGRICKRPGLPPQCTDYTILDESDRTHTYYPSYGNMVDTTQVGDGYVKSPKWNGPGWYRFQTPAGTKISKFYTSMGTCGSPAAIWMKSTHPSTTGTTVYNIELCHNKNYYESCSRAGNSGKVTHCGDFFVYRLPDQPGGRYCSF